MIGVTVAAVFGQCELMKCDEMMEREFFRMVIPMLNG